MDAEVVSWPGHHKVLTIVEPPANAISREQALAILRESHDPAYELPITDVRFGTLDSPYPAAHHPDGAVERMFVHRPVWVITVTHVGWHTGRGPRSEPTYGETHMNYVLDAFTGERLGGFN